MDIDKVAKEIEGIYKALETNFHSDARELINAAKKYLTTLHGSSAAQQIYIDAMKNFSNYPEKHFVDLHEKSMQILNHLNEDQQKQQNFLKSFYTTFILPIEKNLEQDFNVIQTHHKNYTTKAKLSLETYKRASNTVKKLKNRNYFTKRNLDKEIKGMQFFQEERNKIEMFFVEQKNEAQKLSKRRYDFILEKQFQLLNLKDDNATIINDDGDDGYKENFELPEIDYDFEEEFIEGAPKLSRSSSMSSSLSFFMKKMTFSSNNATLKMNDDNLWVDGILRRTRSYAWNDLWEDER